MWSIKRVPLQIISLKNDFSLKMYANYLIAMVYHYININNEDVSFYTNVLSISVTEPDQYLNFFKDHKTIKAITWKHVHRIISPNTQIKGDCLKINLEIAFIRRATVIPFYPLIGFFVKVHTCFRKSRGLSLVWL